MKNSFLDSYMKKRNSFTIKIISIMALVILLVAITGVTAYNRFSEVVSEIARNTRPDVRLITCKSLLTDLATAENTVKTYSLSKDATELEVFYRSIDAAESKVRQLYRTSRPENQSVVSIERLDSLIQTKFSVLDSMLLMQDQFRVQEALDKVMEEIERSVARENQQRKLQIDNKQEVDTTANEEPKEEKVGFLRRLFKSRKKKAEEAVDTVQALVEVDDTEEVTIGNVSKEVRDVKVEEQGIELKARELELRLIRKDRAITEKILGVINQIEAEEEKKLEQKVEEAGQVMRDTNQQIALFCVVAALLLIFMAATIINYVRNNNRYRRALKHAKRETEELANAKQRFLANVSHEIRTPMNAIVGFTSQMADGELNQDQQEKLDMVRKSADHLLYIINDVLDFTKLQAGKLKLENIGFEPETVIRETASLIRPLVEEKGLEMHCNISPSVPRILIGDPHRLRQILLNLLSNAVKFTDRGLIEIKVLPVQVSEKTVQIRFQVIDSGIGMTSYQSKKVFEEFEQAEVSTSRNYGGTGLGLSIVNMLTKLHDGTIRIKSAKDQGTTVSIDLVYTVGDEHSLNTQEIALELNMDKLKGAKILIVDDELFNRKLLNSLLSKYDAELEEASDGMEAVAKARRKKYDIILMDTRMPKLNGVKAAKQIREMEGSNAQTPIIAVTAAVEQTDRKKYHDAGMNAFIAKPFRKDELLRELVRLLGDDTSGAIGKEGDENDGENTDLDFSELKSLSNNDLAFYQEMLEVFVSSTTEGIDNLQEAVADQRWEKAADWAHKICTPARHLGAEKLYKNLKSIELNCREGTNLENIPELVSVCVQDANRAIELVEAEIKRVKENEKG